MKKFFLFLFPIASLVCSGIAASSHPIQVSTVCSGSAPAAQVHTTQTPSDSLQVVDMNRTFSVGGRALMCLRSPKAEKKELKALSWTLVNNRAADQNFVRLEVKNEKTGEMEVYNNWNGNVNVHMLKSEKGTITYQVFDDTFSHLVITQLSKDSDIYVILYYSELLNK